MQGKATQKVLGKDIKVGKYWIDVDYPEGPPQEYERGGYANCLNPLAVVQYIA